MTKEELIKFLEENLSVELYAGCSGDGHTKDQEIEVTIMLCGEAIAADRSTISIE